MKLDLEVLFLEVLEVSFQKGAVDDQKRILNSCRVEADVGMNLLGK